LLERWRDSEDAPVINKLMQLDIPEAKQETHATSLNDAFKNLRQKHRDLRLQELLNKSHNTELSGEEKTELSQLYLS